MPESRVRFVQFPHPGSEHRPDVANTKSWHRIDKMHARKFMSLSGAWLEGAERRPGSLWAWAEWEPESTVITKLSQPSPHHPRYLWEPHFAPKSDYSSLHNTDPFIFEGFYYTNCRQSASRGLRQLARGSVIVFGTGQGHGWVIDTVFVVSDYIDHHVTTFEQRLRGNVPDEYFDITLIPTWSRETGELRFYRGATFDNPVDGMFSFFPCMASGCVGFPRPPVTLPNQFFNPKSSQAAKGCSLTGPPHDPADVKQLWQSLLDQVRAAGLLPGISARMPSKRDHQLANQATIQRELPRLSETNPGTWQS